MKKRAAAITIMMAMTLAACGSTAAQAGESVKATEPAAQSETESPENTEGNTQTETAGGAGDQTAADAGAEDDLFSDRDKSGDYDADSAVSISLDGDTASCADESVTTEGQTVTITREGTYLISGTLSDGMIIVDADDSAKVQLVLDGAQIASSSSAAIYVKQADKVFITLADGSENILSSGESFEAIDENNIDAVVYSKEDLTINGSGSLSVTSPAGHGIVSKDDLKVTGGAITVTAAGQGLSGKDSVRIAGGSIDITSGTDGIHSENEEDAEKGYVYISGGSFVIRSADDGISASGTLEIRDGEFDITAGEGSANVQLSSGGDWMMGGGMPGSQTGNDTDFSGSVKGIKAGGNLLISGGSFTVDAEDDALHSNSDLTIDGGSFEISSGDDGMHADGTTTVSGGKINVTKSYEGIEGLSIYISGGEISIVSADDGLNAAGGNDGSGDAMFGGMGDVSADSLLQISGGKLIVDASGDGLDSNGTLEMTGGEVYVSGPTNNGNGALDYGISASISGGTIIAAGASGMAENFSSADQGVMLVTVDGQNGGTITLTDGSGSVLATWTDEKSYDSVLISTPEIREGETYTLTAGSYTASVTMDSLIYGSGMGMGGMPGGMGGQGMRPGSGMGGQGMQPGSGMGGPGRR